MKTHYFSNKKWFLPLFLTFALGINLLAQKQNFTVVIDAGHGGVDKGATAENYSEKEIVLDIAKLVKEMSPHLNIVLTRDQDEMYSLLDRADDINKLNPNLALSLHVNNANNPEAHGFEIYVNRDSNDFITKKFTDILQEQFNDGTELKERGDVKSAKFMLLRTTKAPTVILEMGFMSNPKDLDYISSAKGKQEIASSIVQSINKLKEYM